MSVTVVVLTEETLLVLVVAEAAAGVDGPDETYTGAEGKPLVES